MKTIVAILTSEKLAIKIIQICTVGIFALGLLLLAKIVNAAPPKQMTAEITKGVFITLTNEPCTMYEMPKDVFLWQATGEDKTVKETATGCFQLEDDMVIINLVNDKNGNEYGYVLKQELFKPVEVY